MDTRAPGTQYLTGPQFPAETLCAAFGGPRREGMLDSADGYARRFRWSASAKELQHELTTSNAVALHVGPLWREDYSLNLAARAAKNKELIATNASIDRTEVRFDFDLTDATELREACGCGADKFRLCTRCWRAAGAAAEVLDVCLRAYMPALERICFVFSGNRGFHVWCGPARPEGNLRAAALFTCMEPTQLEAMARECAPLQQALGHWREHVGTDAPLRFDAAVTSDRAHCMRSPLTPHGSTHLISTPFVPPGRDPTDAWIRAEGRREALAPHALLTTEAERAQLRTGVDVFTRTFLV